MLAVSARPIPTRPAIDGLKLAEGAKCALSAIGNVWFVIATSEPAGLVPLIQTRIARPMSCTVVTYVVVVAPGICTHVSRSPCGSQRRHEYVKTIGGEPCHVPAVSHSVCSTT